MNAREQRPCDSESLTQDHTRFIDEVESRAMRMQDAAYALGRKRGFADAAAVQMPSASAGDFRRAAEDLAARARASGFVITIDQQSAMPPAMGRHVDVVTIRQVRGAA